MKVILVIKNKIEGVVQKWLIFFEKNLSKIANLDQKTCKEKERKESFGKTPYSLTSSYKLQKALLQHQGSNISFVYLKTVKQFISSSSGFVSEIVFKIFLLFTRKLRFIFFFYFTETSLKKFCRKYSICRKFHFS